MNFRKFYLIILLLGVSSIVESKAQRMIVGRIDADGKLIMTTKQDEARQLMQQVSNQRMSMSININDISFTRLNMGQVCITGYEKAPDGKIVRGIRIQCAQDDENNLIVSRQSYCQKTIGKTFAETAIE